MYLIIESLSAFTRIQNMLLERVNILWFYICKLFSRNRKKNFFIDFFSLSALRVKPFSLILICLYHNYITSRRLTLETLQMDKLCSVLWMCQNRRIRDWCLVNLSLHCFLVHLHVHAYSWWTSFMAFLEKCGSNVWKSAAVLVFRDVVRNHAWPPTP